MKMQNNLKLYNPIPPDNIVECTWPSAIKSASLDFYKMKI